MADQQTKGEIKPTEGILKRDQVIIHTMPQRYIHAPVKGRGGSKHTGLLILVLGLFILAAVLGGLYYFFVYQEEGKEFLAGLFPAESGVEEPAVTRKKEPPAGSGPGGQEPDETADKEPAVDREETTETGRGADTEEEAADKAGGMSTSTIPDMAEEADEAAATSAPDEVRQASDSDRDGLSDREELLLGTVVDSSDSDNDGYEDRAELLNLYNPAGEGNLIVNSGIARYDNASFGYSLYYPKFWNIKTVGGNESVVFSADNKQFIQIIAVKNELNYNIDGWYRNQTEANIIKSTQRVYKNEWGGIKSEDGLTYYLLPNNGAYIYTLTYNLGVDNTAYFSSILEMMVKSLAVR